jgi:PHP family Zn ribbon phosphoesterase
MQFIADFHVHSHFSRATSKDMCPEDIWKWAQLKGVRVIGTGDFTHPKWFKELNEKLEPEGDGLFALKRGYRSEEVPLSCRTDLRFILTAEISCIYSKNGRTRKIHSIILAPDFAAAARLNLALSRIGNLHSDGRPILGLDAKELLKITLEASPEAMLIPAHAWTPHFSVFGAASGFNAIEECFEELTPNIHRQIRL